MDNTKSSRNKLNIDYDKWHEKIYGEKAAGVIHLSQWHESALMLSPPLKGHKVLEVGCGVGDFAIYLVGQGAQVTAVDFSQQAIELAKKKAEEKNSSVDFQIADVQKLPFETASFDLIFSCENLEHVPNPQLSLNELYRVLKPSGRLILTTENYSNAMILAWIVSWLRHKPFNSGAGVQPLEHFFVFWNVKRMFRKTGFQVERMIGSHHVFLLLPRLDPSSFVKERFENPIARKFFFPFARHIAFSAVKSPAKT